MFIVPKWPAPKHIKALCTTREGGASFPPFDGFNLATHVGDDLSSVEKNRHTLVSQANLPSAPYWLDQQHTNVAIELSKERLNSLNIKNSPPPIADASWTMQKGCVSIVMTADCLPLLITNQQGSLVSAIHAGWKGLHKGIVSKTIQSFLAKEGGESHALLVWIGPAISQEYFEVGQEVLDAFVQKCPKNAEFFTPPSVLNTKKSFKYQADLVGLVRKELNKLGVTNIYGGDLCTYAQSEQFYSYRRSGKTGRIASFIWME